MIETAQDPEGALLDKKTKQNKTKQNGSISCLQKEKRKKNKRLQSLRPSWIRRLKQLLIRTIVTGLLVPAEGIQITI